MLPVARLQVAAWRCCKLVEWALAMYLSAQRDAPVDLPLQNETEVWQAGTCG
ncbi:hypothetical protein SBA3_750009 [Candidatus Sulfopaludibacter sp. SbA3]|nr:hypothetical protein SBA3_750009 [Candidatus Sulfopaludibacter sp. SbA3]